MLVVLGKRLPIVRLQINGLPTEIVHSFKFLGTVICSGMDWETNTNSILKKAQQIIYFLRQRKKLGLQREILIQFYRAVTESVLCFSLPVWWQQHTGPEDTCEPCHQERRANCRARAALILWRRHSLSGLSPDSGGPLQTGSTQHVNGSSCCRLGGGRGR